jgi:hypothetical protein
VRMSAARCGNEQYTRAKEASHDSRQSSAGASPAAKRNDLSTPLQARRLRYTLRQARALRKARTPKAFPRRERR